MEYAGSKKIHKFDFNGAIADDARIPDMRERYENILLDCMRSKGYIPHYDLDPVFNLKYNKKQFEFKLTIYGVYVGKAKAKCYQGVSGNKMVPANTTEPKKSEESCKSVESP